MLQIGQKYTSSLTVSASDTAIAIGSGDMEVLATPRMVALMENAAMMAVAANLQEGETTVGGYIATSHLRPTAVGATITATATLTNIEGRKLSFSVEAYEGDSLLGKGEHIRFIVDRTKFLSKL